MVYRLIAPSWLLEKDPSKPKVLEGEFQKDEIEDYNSAGYNAYYFPNYPSRYDKNKTVSGEQIDTFKFVFVDMDLKANTYPSKQAFLETLQSFKLTPTYVIDSGNGVHAYWNVHDLDAVSYLKLQRRLMRFFSTDEAVCKILQLMRVPGTFNNKEQGKPKLCGYLSNSENTYVSEQLDSELPPLTKDDEEYCLRHYNQTYNKNSEVTIVDELPIKFYKLLRGSTEVKEIWKGEFDDRSKADYRLAHIMFAEGFTKDEAMSVLVNCNKALSRAPTHRYNYASNIADKIWTFEKGDTSVPLSNSVRDILKRGQAIQGTRLPCWEVFDGTNAGFRLTQVLGLIGGSGSGKTTLALNYFYHFTRLNPEYIHVFVSLEQGEAEIALRWEKLCGDNDRLHDKVHVLGNYDTNGEYRNLSLQEIEEYLLDLEKRTGFKVGCCVIDHIGVLKKQSKEGEFQGIIDVCHGLKAFAIRTNTFLVIQSQTSREKAGIGDIELNKDAAFGTSMFENYCDYVVTTWQPLKRVYSQAPHMTATAFKLCKIRNKHIKKDKIKEDLVYALMYDTDDERLREMTESEAEAYDHFSNIATTLRNKDRKREPTKLTKIDWVGKNAKVDTDKR